MAARETSSSGPSATGGGTSGVLAAAQRDSAAGSNLNSPHVGKKV